MPVRSKPCSPYKAFLAGGAAGGVDVAHATRSSANGTSFFMTGMLARPTVNRHGQLVRANDRVDRCNDLQRGAAGDDRRSVGHQRLAAVLLPPPADEDVLADLADHQLAAGGATARTELDDE